MGMGSQNGKPIHSHWEMPETHHESMKRDLGEFQKDPRCGSYIDYRFPRARMRGIQSAHTGGLGHVMGENRPIPRLPGFHRPTSAKRTRANLGINESTVHTFGDVPPEVGVQGGPASHRSCSVFVGHTKDSRPLDDLQGRPPTISDGRLMHSESHFGKIGSKHMVNTRCVPELYNKRRLAFRDPGPNLRAEPLTTTSHQVGLFYHFHKLKPMVGKPNWKDRLDFLRYDWHHDFSGIPDDVASTRSSRRSSRRGVQRSQSDTMLNRTT
jgi:hypothetical protein